MPITTQITLAGIDLAWQGDKNPSAIAIGSLEGKCLTLKELEPAVYGMSNVLASLNQYPNLTGIAIDAPLIINNPRGQRACENALGRDYASRKSSCHPSNQSLYPNSQSVYLASLLKRQGFQHLSTSKWQIECYPHPSIIECFALPERLLYKKGKVAQKKAGQVELDKLLLSLAQSKVLSLQIPASFQKFLAESYINNLKGQALKSNEVALDAMICLYIAGLYQTQVPSTAYGNTDDGYI